MTLIIITGSIKRLEDDARDYWTIEAMTKYGGSFVKALAEAARHADPQNLGRIKIAWPEHWEEYEKTGRELEAKHDRGEK